MAQITSGKISYSQTRQAAQFEPKKAEVELSFVVEEGEDFHAVAKIAEDFAIAKVQEMIGATKPAPAKAVQAAPPAPKTSPAVDTTPVPSKEAYAAKEAAKASVPKVPPKAKKPEPVAADPADMGTSDDDLLGAPTPVVVEVAKTITDQDLTSAITKVNQKLNNVVAIRQLVATFVAPPKGSRDIPQERRQEFIDKLNGLIK